MEDLDDDWDDAAHMRAVHRDLAELPALHRLGHPVVRHAAETFPEGDATCDIAREGITGLTNPMWWKLKTTRWRGAVWEDDQGQAWLCAAGRRYAGEAKDFYKSFSAQVASKGASYFLPHRDDYERLDYERVVVAVSAWEVRCADEVADAFDAACDGSEQIVQIPGIFDNHPDLATVAISVDRVGVESDEVAEVLLEIDVRDHRHAGILEWADLTFLAAIDPDEQAWEAGHTGHARLYSLVISGDQLGGLRSAANGAKGSIRTALPGTDAHWTHRAGLTEGMIDGTAIQALCGTWFVPRQDHVGRPVCPRCEHRYAMLAPA